MYLHVKKLFLIIRFWSDIDIIVIKKIFTLWHIKTPISGQNVIFWRSFVCLSFLTIVLIIGLLLLFIIFLLLAHRAVLPQAIPMRMLMKKKTNKCNEILNKDAIKQKSYIYEKTDIFYRFFSLTRRWRPLKTTAKAPCPIKSLVLYSYSPTWTILLFGWESMIFSVVCCFVYYLKLNRYT